MMRTIKFLFLAAFLLFAGTSFSQNPTRLEVIGGQGHLSWYYYFIPGSVQYLPDSFIFDETRSWDKSYYSFGIMYHFPLAKTTRVSINTSYSGSSNNTLAAIAIWDGRIMHVTKGTSSIDITLPPGSYTFAVTPIPSSYQGVTFLPSSVSYEALVSAAQIVQNISGNLSISVVGNAVN